jgi:UDP-glucose 4-epimerase
VDKEAVFVLGDLGNRDDIERIFKEYSIDAVMHFTANSLVRESVTEPLKYYENNVSATFVLLKAMIEHRIKNSSFLLQL